MNKDFRKIIYSCLFPALVILIMWVVKIIEVFTHSDFGTLGISPHSLHGLIGIVTAPYIHADFKHLIANTVPMFVSLSIANYFYKEIFYHIFFLIWLFTGIWVWSFAQSGTFHIGASGLVYGYVSFLLFSGIIRRNARLMAISLLIVFLYGGLFWGIFPEFFPKRNISWESHLMGGLAGIVMAFFYRKKGMQREQYHWDEEEDDDENAEYLKKDDECEGKDCR